MGIIRLLKIRWLERHSLCRFHNTLPDDQMEEDSVGWKRGRGDMHTKFCPEVLKVRDRQEDNLTKLN
jgi:hypothetical protein